jgi:hypothetical protein
MITGKLFEPFPLLKALSALCVHDSSTVIECIELAGQFKFIRKKTMKKVNPHGIFDQ